MIKETIIVIIIITTMKSENNSKTIHLEKNKQKNKQHI